MAQQGKYGYYDFERFEPHRSAGSAAPKYNTAPQKKPDLRLVKKPAPSKAQLKREANAALVKSIRILAVAAVALLLFGMAIYSRVLLDETNREISSYNSKIENLNSDTVRLKNELNAVASIDKVDDYAANVLGMVKVQDYQVVYVDLSDGDRVLMANGEEVKADEVINAENE